MQAHIETLLGRPALEKFRVQTAPQITKKSCEDQLATKVESLGAKRQTLSFAQEKVVKLNTQIATNTEGIVTVQSEIGVLETEEC